QALVDKKRIVIFEEVVREILQLNDAECVVCLPNEEIFTGLARMGYDKPSTKLTFYKAFFSTQWNTAFHPQTDGQSERTMLAVRDITKEAEAQIPAQDDDVQEHAEEEVATDVVPPTPTSLPSSPVISSSPPHQSPSPPQPQAAEVSSHVFQQVLDTCSALVLKVEGMETANAAQQLEILKLKARVKKLEKLNKVEGMETANAAQQLEILKLKARVKKLEKLNKRRISVDMDQDEGIELVVDQEKDVEIEGRQAYKQAEIYNIDLDHSSKVLSMQEDDTKVQEAIEVVTTAKLITEVVTAASTQVVAASTPIFVAKPKTLKIDVVAPAVSTKRRKGVVIRDPEEELH
nr:hypothetical protein [Tanacetum cinerariifolium]